MTKLSDYVVTVEAGLEQANYDVAVSMGLPIAPGTPNSGKRPVVFGMFTAQGHVSFGEYYGVPDPVSYSRSVSSNCHAGGEGGTDAIPRLWS